MKNIFYLISSLMIVAVPQLVSAAITVPTTGQTGLPDSDFTTVIANVTKFVTSIIAVLAVLMIIVSGIVYITSAGDSEKVSQAKSWLTYSIVGLIIALLGYTIVTGVGSALKAW